MSKFSEILKNRNFFLLFLGQIISQVGDKLGQIALIAFVYARTPQSTVGIAKILLPTIIPVFVIGPLAGVYVDRWDRRRTMYISDFLRAALLLVIPLFLFYSKGFIPIYLVIFLVFCIGRFFIPAKLSIVPELVKNKDLLMANSLIHITGMIATVLGYGVSGIVVESLGAKSGFYLDALSFLISGTLIFLIVKRTSSHTSLTKVGKEIVEVIKKSVFAEIKEGAAYFFNKKDIRFTAGIFFILASSLGAVSTVMIVFVQKMLGSVVKDLGLLIMCLGIGLFFGSLVYGRFGQRVSRYKIIFVSLILSGIMLVIFAVTIQRYPYFPIAALLSLLFGLLISPIIIASNTIVHNVSDSEMMGKIFSSLEIVMHVGFLLFMFIGSVLAERFSQVSMLVAVGFLFAAVGIVNLAHHRKIPWLD